MTRSLSLLRPDDPSAKPLQSVSNRVAGAWRGLAGGGGGAGGLGEAIGGQPAGTFEYSANRGLAAMFRVSAPARLQGASWEPDDPVVSPGAARRVVLMNADRSEYLAVSDWTSEPPPEEKTEEALPYLVPYNAEVGVDYWNGVETSPDSDGLIVSLFIRLRSAGTAEFEGVMIAPSESNVATIPTGQTTRWSLVNDIVTEGTGYVLTGKIYGTLL